MRKQADMLYSTTVDTAEETRREAEGGTDNTKARK